MTRRSQVHTPPPAISQLKQNNQGRGGGQVPEPAHHGMRWNDVDVSIRRCIVSLASVAALAGCSTNDARVDTAGTAAPTSATVVASSSAGEITSAGIPETTVAETADEAPAASASTPPTVSQRPLFDFADASTADGWRVVNDTVMGGVSSGELQWSDGELVFDGELSLDNNGGFASIRSPGIDPVLAARWAAVEGPRVQLTGGGRTWTLEVRTADTDDGGWIASVPTSEGVTDLTAPWSSFEPVTRFLESRPAQEPLDPSRIVSIAFYLVDGIEGPFRLGVRSIS